MINARDNVSFDQWLDETFGRAVSGEWYPQFVPADDWPPPVADHLLVEYLTRLFEDSDNALCYYSDKQIAAGLWELGPGDAHCVYNPEIAIDARERLIRSVATFFRDFFNVRCIPKLSHLDKEQTEPLNGICYMWWEVITWGWAKDDPDAERLRVADTDVMEMVLGLPNPACKESALHGLGHMVRQSDRALEIIDRLLGGPADLTPGLVDYAQAARTGCIQ